MTPTYSRAYSYHPSSTKPLDVASLNKINAKELSPEQMDSWLLEGLILEKSGQTAQAKEIYQSLSKAGMKEATTLYKLIDTSKTNADTDKVTQQTGLEKAVSWLEEAVKNGYKMALFYLGDIYSDQKGGSYDRQKANSFYANAFQDLELVRACTNPDNSPCSVERLVHIKDAAASIIADENSHPTSVKNAVFFIVEQGYSLFVENNVFQNNNEAFNFIHQFHNYLISSKNQKHENQKLDFLISMCTLLKMNQFDVVRDHVNFFNNSSSFQKPAT